jgi:hypothetical protein
LSSVRTPLPGAVSLERHVRRPAGYQTRKKLISPREMLMKNRYAIALAVLGIILVLGIFLIIAMNLGDKTGNDTDDPNGTTGMHFVGSR